MNNGRFNTLNKYVFDIQKQVNATAAAIYIIQNNTVVNEMYSGRHDFEPLSRLVNPQSQFNVGSVRKTYLAFAISLLIEQRKIFSIDDEVRFYLRELNDITAGITIRHCLTHTHGLELREGNFYNSFVPGENWAYTSPGITILIELVKCLTGQTFADFINNELINPIGLVETGWRTNYQEQLIYNNHYSDKNNWVGPNNSPTGDQSNLFISASELALWGSLHLNKGNINGKQMYPKSIFDRIVTLQTPNTLPLDLPRQGFIWWLQSNTPQNQIGDEVPEGSFQILGITGCACLIIPKYNVVAVRMYNQLNNTNGYNYLNDIRQFGNEVTKALKVNPKQAYDIC